jgi:hypothetical protein
MTVAESDHGEEVPVRNNSAFVQCLQGMMDDHKISQADIAYTLDQSAQYVNDVMRNRRNPFSTQDLARLARTYSFDLQALLIARAWSVKGIDIPEYATFAQVEEAVRGLWKKNREKEFVS